MIAVFGRLLLIGLVCIPVALLIAYGAEAIMGPDQSYTVRFLVGAGIGALTVLVVYAVAAPWIAGEPS